jgi:hypothetical protein
VYTDVVPHVAPGYWLVPIPNTNCIRIEPKAQLSVLVLVDRREGCIAEQATPRNTRDMTCRAT